MENSMHGQIHQFSIPTQRISFFFSGPRKVLLQLYADQMIHKLILWTRSRFLLKSKKKKKKKITFLFLFVVCLFFLNRVIFGVSVLDYASWGCFTNILS